jgi:flagellar protein FlgJ
VASLPSDWLLNLYPFSRKSFQSTHEREFKMVEVLGAISPRTVATNATVHRTEELRETARALEATFLAEMLKSIGFGKPMEGFGGGVGEEQFSSFLAQAQAEAIAAKGGIGLAEAIFNDLVAGERGRV